MRSYLAVTPRAENLTPSSQNLDFASVCVQNKLVLSPVQEAQPGFSRGELCICLCGSCSSWHQSLETAFTVELFLLWFLPKKRRKAASWGSSILTSPISALCFEVKRLHTAPKLALSSPFHQLPTGFITVVKKTSKKVSVPTVTRFFTNSFSVALLVWNSLPYSTKHPVTHLKCL